MGKEAEQDNRILVCRGGSWSLLPAYARVENRGAFVRGQRLDNLGVRLVRRRSALERLADGIREEVGDEEGG
jgi:formylglycine-generating enzyme required for sulfatase activity